MLEAYSNNVAVAVNSPIPLNVTSLEKCCDTQKSGTASIQLNKCGVYRVTVDADVTAAAVGVVDLAMFRNGVLQPQAVGSASITAAGNVVNIAFETLVQVSENNNKCCPCSTPTTIFIQNGALAATYNHINVTAVKIA